MKPNFHPFQGEVLVLVLGAPARSHGGILLPDIAKTKDAIGRPDMVLGKVLRLGTWPQWEDGRLRPYEMKRGDTVLIDPSLGKVLIENGAQYRILEHTQIAAIVTQDEPTPSPTPESGPVTSSAIHCSEN